MKSVHNKNNLLANELCYYGNFEPQKNNCIQLKNKYDHVTIYIKVGSGNFVAGITKKEIVDRIESNTYFVCFDSNITKMYIMNVLKLDALDKRFLSEKVFNESFRKVNIEDN